MLEGTLYQIMLVVYIVVGIFLLVVLWRLYLVLTDLNDASKRIAAITSDLNKGFDIVKEWLLNFKELTAGFINSFKSMEKIKDKVEGMFENNKTKTKNNKE